MLKDNYICYCKQGKIDLVIEKPDYFHHQIVHARTYNILKAIGIPHHDGSPNNLELSSKKTTYET
jgi:hypothetical protein